MHVSGARPGVPFWLVLGQSNNAGWKATVAGKDAGQSTLVNGFANGWLIKPGTKDFDVTLTWTPQTRVWIALAISACRARAVPVSSRFVAGVDVRRASRTRATTAMPC